MELRYTILPSILRLIYVLHDQRSQSLPATIESDTVFTELPLA